MFKGFWLWILLALGMLGGAFYLAAGELWIFIDLASFAVAIVLAVLISFTAHSPREIAGYIRQSRDSIDLDKTQASRGIVYFSYLQAIIITFGLMFTVIGQVAILGNLTNDSSVFKGFSTSLITSLYSVIFSLVITQPFIGALKAKLARAGEAV